MHHKWNECKKRWWVLISGLIKKFPNTYEFCNNDINEFILLVKKSVYPYAYIDSWERFDETSLSDKEAFYSKLYLDEITDEYYIHVQKAFKEFSINNLVNIMIYIIKVIHYCLQVNLRILEIKILKYMNLILLILYLHLD